MRTAATVFIAVCLIAITGAASDPATAQVATALLVEGEPLPDAPSETITVISQTAVNHQRGYAILITTSAGGGRSTIWGAATDGPGATLRFESTIGNLEQNSFESFFGVGTANGTDVVSCYSATCTDTATGADGLDSSWQDDVVAALEDELYPNESDRYWSFASRPGALADGTPVFVGGITDTPGGSTQQRGIFMGTSATPILVGGDVVPGIPVPIDLTGIDFDYRFSGDGERYITPVTAGNLAYVVLTGTALEIGAGVVAEGNPVPPESGGLAGELWVNFDFMGITDAGSYMFTGDTDAVTTSDEIVVVDGLIRYREGDAIDGETITGAIEGGYFNADGDIALIWDVEDGTGSLEALIVNDFVVIREGDPVDLDGDGEVDPGTRLDNFTGISSLTMGDRAGFEDVQVYFTADVETPLARPQGSGPDAFGEEDGIESGIERTETVTTSGRTQARQLVVEAAFRIDVPVTGLGVTDAQTRPGIRSVAVAENPIPRTAITTLTIDLARSESVEVSVFAVSGRLVRDLGSPSLPAGTHAIAWDHADAEGRQVSPGAYWLVVSTSQQRQAVRIVLLD